MSESSRSFKNAGIPEYLDPGDPRSSGVFRSLNRGFLETLDPCRRLAGNKGRAFRETVVPERRQTRDLSVN